MVADVNYLPDDYPDGHSPFCPKECDHPCHDAYDLTLNRDPKEPDMKFTLKRTFAEWRTDAVEVGFADNVDPQEALAYVEENVQRIYEVAVVGAPKRVNWTESAFIVTAQVLYEDERGPDAGLDDEWTVEVES